MFELLVLAIAPALFILWYVYRKDCYEPEPLGMVVRAFLLGALMVIPAAVIEYPFPSDLITSSVVAPIVEELLKFSVVFFLFTVFLNSMNQLTGSYMLLLQVWDLPLWKISSMYLKEALRSGSSGRAPRFSDICSS